MLDRLHANGRAFVEQLKAAGPLLLVLDECHHLLEVWGRLLGELLDQLPDAMVLGLTATPPEALTADQALLVDELFGAPLYRARIPAVVKVGDLAPYVELAWLTTPTPERGRLAQGGGGAVPGADHPADRTRRSARCRSCSGWTRGSWRAGRRGSTWSRSSPSVCRAVLRLHHVGLLGLPPGARMHEEHRTAPTADDWVPAGRRLADAATSPRPGCPRTSRSSRRYAARCRRSATSGPSSGIRRGRSPVDRVLARSRVQDRRRRRDRRAPSTATSPSGCGCWCSATTSGPAPPCPPT